ncbi:formyltetrahydrofolate deformylase [Pontibacterium granulatum]|uniref:formyltetrahydrofolate deformylase n=1 Tax=Pontibacterium granulatum TaxID=2036029 RepID=UPI00249BC5F8|nr:formyltetrahydrofolate deformylase [Pontibacterium granulatum]MDI3326318.1 formyltetrahydrofolate deformylase [Pontibacterium granulatum]
MNKQKIVLTLACDDSKGIISTVSSYISSCGGNIVESGQYVDSDENRFFMRLCFSVEDFFSLEDFKSGFSEALADFQVDWSVHDLAVKPRVMIMVSQLGHCLNDLLYRHSINQLPMELVSIVSNHETYRSRAEHEGVDFYYLPITAETKPEQEAQLIKLIEDQEIDLVILARYMQVLSDDLCQKLAGKVINIHHSFLPSFKGGKPYHQAHDRGVKLIGATAHYVTADLDEGPIIEQGVKRVDHAVSANAMVAIGRDTECQVLAKAVKLQLEHRILLNEHRTVIFE